MAASNKKASTAISDTAAAEALAGDEALRVEDVMRILHLSRNTVYKLARTGEIPSFRVGRQLRFHRDDVEAHIAGGAGAGMASGKAAGSGAGAGAAQAGSAAKLMQPADVAEPLPAWARGSLIIGGQDIAADVLANYLAGLGVKILRAHANAYLSLSRMYLGTCDAALVDLWNEGEQRYNIPYVRTMLPGLSLIVMRMYKHRVGFTVASRNPLKISSWGDLLKEGVHITNRERGAATRVLLDEKMRYLEADASTIDGYGREVASELTQALLVARGLANVAITSERAWRKVRGLDFLPMQDESVDLVIVKNARTRPLIKAVRPLLRTGAFRSEFDSTLTDTGLMGEVLFES